MKKIVIIDGGPRKTMTTARMIEEFKKGALSLNEQDGEGVEVKHIRLYDIDYKGCVSCLACKVKGSKHTVVCARKDELTDVLSECNEADGLVFASPIYYSSVTGAMQSFFERLIYPWSSYNDFSINAPRRIPTATIYSMNAQEDQLHYMEPQIKNFEEHIEWALQKPERIMALNTLQVKNYDRYDMNGFDIPGKYKWNEEHHADELRNAFEAGARMAERVSSPTPALPKGGGSR